jgi:hypothetical protein
MNHASSVYGNIRARSPGMDIEGGGGGALPLSSLGTDPRHGSKTFSRVGSASPVRCIFLLFINYFYLAPADVITTFTLF